MIQGLKRRSETGTEAGTETEIETGIKTVVETGIETKTKTETGKWTGNGTEVGTDKNLICHLFYGLWLGSSYLALIISKLNTCVTKSRQNCQKSLRIKAK